MYGRSGTGKTTIAGSFPKPALLINVRDYGEDSISDILGIDIMDIDSWDDFEEAYWYLLDNGKYLGPHEQYKGKKYKTVIIDTVSQLQGVALMEMMGVRPEQIGWGTLTRKQWGTVSAKLKEWLLLFRDLIMFADMDVVFIAQDRIFNIEDEEVKKEGNVTSTTLDPEVSLQLMPSVAKVLNAAVHVIANTFIRERVEKTKVKGKIRETKTIEYCLRVGPDPIYVTKIRSPKSRSIPSVIVDPDYDKLQEGI